MTKHYGSAVIGSGQTVPLFAMVLAQRGKKTPEGLLLTLKVHGKSPEVTSCLRRANQRVTTYTMYSDPPLGRVGLGHGAAQTAVKSGRRILYADPPTDNTPDAKEEGGTTGLIRLIDDVEPLAAKNV